MAELKVTVQVEQDGVVLPGFPIVERVVVEQVVPWTPLRHDPSPSEAFVALPTTTIVTLQALIVRPNRLLVVRYDGQTDAGIEIEPGGLLLVLGGRADAGPVANVKASATETTLIHGLAAGAGP